jgi:hypothetical protein
MPRPAIVSRVLLASLPLCLVPPGAAVAQPLANSVTGLSGVQGQNGWTYGFYEVVGGSGGPFQQLPFFDGISWHRAQGVGGYHTRLDADGGHPNGLITSGGAVPIDNWAVRRWTSAVETRVVIEGQVRVNQPGGNGVIARIIVDGDEEWTQVVTHDAPRIFAIVAGTHINMTVEFALDASGNDHLDDSTFEVEITEFACLPDITGTAIPGAPGYLVPDGILDNNDFFAYLTEFAAGNLQVCDLTCWPCFGPPGGNPPVCDNTDFFYYLSMFAAGC